MIHENLKQLRTHHQLTQETLAFKLGVSRQVIAKWEKGESTPDLAHCQVLADLYNVTIDNLVNYEAAHLELDVPMPPKGKHFFGVTKLGERGQVVIPKEARDIFKLQPGDSLIFLGDEDRGLAIVPDHMLQTFLNLVKTPLDKEADQ